MVPRIAAPVCAGALALALVAGCGGSGESSQAPVTATPAAASAPQVSQPTAPGEVVRPGPATPRAFTRAIMASRPTVVAFLMPGAADDVAVRGFLRDAHAGATGRGVTWLSYSLKDARRFGDLPELLDVSGTPTVVVIGRDHRVTNVFRGLTDAQLIKQAIHDAKDTVPATSGVVPAPRGAAKAATTKPSKSATGDPGGIALAKRVNASYRGVTGIGATLRGDFSGLKDVTGQLKMVLANARTVKGEFEFAPAAAAEGRTAVLVLDGRLTHVKKPGTSCWLTQPSTDPDELPIELDGRFSPVSSAGGVARVTVHRTETNGNATAETYAIDLKTGHIKSVHSVTKSDGTDVTLTYRLLSKPPTIQPTEPKC